MDDRQNTQLMETCHHAKLSAPLLDAVNINYFFKRDSNKVDKVMFQSANSSQATFMQATQAEPNAGNEIIAEQAVEPAVGDSKQTCQKILTIRIRSHLMHQTQLEFVPIAFYSTSPHLMICQPVMQRTSASCPHCSPALHHI